MYHVHVSFFLFKIFYMYIHFCHILSSQRSNHKQFVPPRLQQHDDLLTSLRYVPEDHSMHGYRCKSRYEWYQTPSDVCIDIMIQDIKAEDIRVKFSENKVSKKETNTIVTELYLYFMFAIG